MRLLLILALFVSLQDATAGRAGKYTRRLIVTSACAVGVWALWPHRNPDIDQTGRVTEVKPPEDHKSVVNFPLFPPRGVGPLNFQLATSDQPQKTVFSWADPNITDAEAELRKLALKEASRRYGLRLGRDGLAIPPISIISEPSLADDGVTLHLKTGEIPYEGKVDIDRPRFEAGWSYSVKFPDYEHHDKEADFSLFAKDIRVTLRYDAAAGNLVVDKFEATLTASFVVITRKTLTDKVLYTSVVAPHPHRLTK